MLQVHPEAVQLLQHIRSILAQQLKYLLMVGAQVIGGKALGVRAAQAKQVSRYGMRLTLVKIFYTALEVVEFTIGNLWPMVLVIPEFCLTLWAAQ